MPSAWLIMLIMENFDFIDNVARRFSIYLDNHLKGTSPAKKKLGLKFLSYIETDSTDFNTTKAVVIQSRKRRSQFFKIEHSIINFRTMVKTTIY